MKYGAQYASHSALRLTQVTSKRGKTEVNVAKDEIELKIVIWSQVLCWVTGVMHYRCLQSVRTTSAQLCTAADAAAAAATDKCSSLPIIVLEIHDVNLLTHLCKLTSSFSAQSPQEQPTVCWLSALFTAIFRFTWHWPSIDTVELVDRHCIREVLDKIRALVLSQAACASVYILVSCV